MFAKDLQPVRWAAAEAPRFLRALHAEVSADRWIYFSIAGYGVAVSAVTFGFGAPFVPLLYVRQLVLFLAVLLLVAPIVAALGGACENPKAPLEGFTKRLVRSVGPRALAGYLLFCAVLAFLGFFTAAKTALPQVTAFAWDQFLADMGRTLHGGLDPETFLAGWIGTRQAELLEFVYSRCWFFVLFGVTAWAAISTRHAHLRSQYFLAFMLSWVLLGNVVAGLFLSGGPMFYGALTGDNARFASLTTSLAGSPTALYAQYLWERYQDGAVGFGSGISAFPSMHISVSVLITLYLSAISQRLGWLGIAFTGVMMIGSVRLGWHYPVDGYASIILTCGIWRIAGSAMRRFAQTSAVEEPVPTLAFPRRPLELHARSLIRASKRRAIANLPHHSAESGTPRNGIVRRLSAKLN